MVFLYIIVFSLICIRNLNLFHLHNRDMGLFDNILWNTSQGRWFMSTVSEFRLENSLTRHFWPIFFLLIPLYWIWNNVQALLIFQTIAVASTALPLFWLAREKTKNGFLSLAIGAGFLLHPLIHEAQIFDFHTEAIIAPLIVYCFYFLYHNRLWPYFICLLLMFMCKEDTFLYAIIFGIYALFFPGKRRTGIVTIIIGLIFGIVVMKFIFPFVRKDLASQYLFLDRYQWLGNSISEIMSTMITRPLYVLKNICTPDRLRTLLLLFTPVAFLPLAAGCAFLLIIPATAEMLLSSFRPQYELVGHYSLVVLPFIYIATIFGAAKILHWPFLGSRRAKAGAIGIYLIVVHLLYTFFMGYTEEATVTGASPLNRNFKITQYQYDKHTQIGHDLINKIPFDAAVASQCCMMPLLTHRQDIYLYRGSNIHPFGDIDIDYILLDLHNSCFPFFPRSPQEEILQLLHNNTYGVMAFTDGWVLLKKGYSSQQNKEVFNYAFKQFYGIIPAENLYRDPGLGSNITDKKAQGKLARYGSTAHDKPGYICFGPYYLYPPGDYQTTYYLKTDKRTNVPVAAIDVVTDQGKNIIAAAEISGIDFVLINEYQAFSLSFHLEKESSLEFRVYFKDQANLWIDKIELTLPQLSPEKKIDYVTNK